MGRGRPSDELRSAIRNSDVSIFATPFTDDRLELAEEAGYLTGWEAATLAREEGVRLCAIQRLGPYSATSYQLMEARQFNEDLSAPADGSLIRVYLPDLGTPSYQPAHKRENEVRDLRQYNQRNRFRGR